MNLELSEKDAAAFRLFMQYYQEFSLLVEHRVFDVKNGTAELHFTPEGKIGAIDVHMKVFRRAKLPVESVAVVKVVV